jgi:hypothetical protein
MKSSCWVHCWCCRGWGGAANNKEPPAAVAAGAVAAVAAGAGVVEVVAALAAVLGSAEGRAIGAEAGPVGVGAEATGSVPVPGSAKEPTDGESRGGGVVDVGEQRRAWDDAPEDDLAVASPAQSVDDAARQTRSVRLQMQRKKAKPKK